jgi:hypothetical protein
MANVNSFNSAQTSYTLQQMKDVKNSGVKAATTNVAQGHTAVSKQNTESNKGVKEESTLSEAARKAIEQSQLKEASDKGGAQNAGKAAGQKKAKEREKTKGEGDIRGADNGKFYKVPDTAQPGDILPTEDGGSLVVGDVAAGVEDTKLSKGQTDRLKHLDSPDNANKQYEAIPDKVRPAVMKMAEKQVGDKAGRKKNADLKTGDAKFGDQVESPILDLTSKLDKRGQVGPAGIRTPKDEKPLNIEDPHADESMKLGAKLQASTGGGNEAFVA